VGHLVQPSRQSKEHNAGLFTSFATREKRKKDLMVCCGQHSGSGTVRKANRRLGIIMKSAKSKPENLITSVCKFRRVIVELEKTNSRQPDQQRHGMA